MAKVLEILRQEHANMARLVGLLEREAARHEAGEVIDFDRIASILAYSLEYSGRYHHPLEDKVYRAVREIAPERAEALTDLEAEHRDLAAATDSFHDVVDRLRNDEQMPRDELGKQCRAYTEHLRRHMQLEESELFQVAESLLSEHEWARMEVDAKAGNDPLFGPNAAPRYAELHRELIALAS